MSKSSSDYTEESGPPRSNFTLCGDDLIRINRFSQSANLTFLFDFNVMLRKSDGSWDESNAKKILEFCSAQASYLVGHFKISKFSPKFQIWQKLCSLSRPLLHCRNNGHWWAIKVTSITFVFDCSETYVMPQVLQPKSVNKQKGGGSPLVYQSPWAQFFTQRQLNQYFLINKNIINMVLLKKAQN